MVERSRIKTSPDSFWHSMNILLTKPHVINKRLWGCKTWKRIVCKPVNALKCVLPKQCNRLEATETVDDFINKILIEAKLEKSGVDEKCALVEVVLTELFPKSFSESKVFQLIVINKETFSVTFYDGTEEVCKHNLCPDFVYSFQLVENEVVLTADSDVNSKSYIWLKNTLLPQIIKWGEAASDSLFDQNICKESLSLVSHQKYYAKYNELKLKYGKEMVKIWPECTDPSKFVYEDIAIATYLLLLWEDEGRSSKKKQIFADLGCGNGLLVYILTKEGHAGVGIDVRKRNIWDMYSRDVKLEEKTVVPSDTSLFPDTDWIIGNHSDELTPWIPVIAAKSSYECNFFLLPCCAYNFDGTKYQRRNSSKSQYHDYLAHIKELCQECGFNVDMDRLKIPSTKRICLVSKGRSYSKENYAEYHDKIQTIVEKDSSLTIAQVNDPTWVKNFKPRVAVEKVRNCTQIDKDLIGSIVKCISGYLLEGFSEGSTWYEGKTVELSELVKLIPQDQLKQLKSECGGMQTLIKNNHSIFKVQSGKVQLRHPKTIDEVNSKSKEGFLKIQQKPCWFYNNHPQGCPLLDTKCSFLHVKS